MINFTTDRELIQSIVRNQQANLAILELENILHEKKRKILQNKIEAQLRHKDSETAKCQEMINERAARYSLADNEIYEKEFIRNELLKKWNDLFQREKIDTAELKFIEHEDKTKRFTADNFSIELSDSEKQSDNIRFLKLSYEADDKKLLFHFSEKDNSESVLYLEFKIEHEERSINSEISGMPVDPTQSYGLYDFLCALEQSDLADNMTVFFNRLEKAEKNLPDKEDELLNKKYASILNDLHKL